MEHAGAAAGGGERLPERPKLGHESLQMDTRRAINEPTAAWNGEKKPEGGFGRACQSLSLLLPSGRPSPRLTSCSFSCVCATHMR